MILITFHQQCVPNIVDESVHQYGIIWGDQSQDDTSTNTPSPNTGTEEVLEQRPEEHERYSPYNEGAVGGALTVVPDDIPESYPEDTPSDNQTIAQNHQFSLPMSNTAMESEHNTGDLADRIRSLVLGTDDVVFQYPDAHHANRMRENLREVRRKRRTRTPASAFRMIPRVRVSSSRRHNPQSGSSPNDSHSLTKKYRATNRINRRETAEEAARRYSLIRNPGRICESSESPSSESPRTRRFSVRDDMKVDFITIL